MRVTARLTVKGFDFQDLSWVGNPKKISYRGLLNKIPVKMEEYRKKGHAGHEGGSLQGNQIQPKVRTPPNPPRCEY